MISEIIDNGFNDLKTILLGVLFMFIILVCLRIIIHFTIRKFLNK